MDEIRVTPSMRPEPTAAAQRTGEVTEKTTKETGTSAPVTRGQVTAEDLKAAMDSARIAGDVRASFSQLLPVSILKSPELMRTEWAWRRLLVDAIMQKVAADHYNQSGFEGSTAGATPLLQPITAAQQLLLEKSLQVLWNHLNTLAQTTNQAASETNWPAPSTEMPLLPFAHVAQSDASHLDDSQRGAVMLDKLQAAVVTETDPRVGGGVFFPAALVQPPLGRQAPAPQKAVRWRAERQTRITSAGQMVYRLKLHIDVAGKPVDITMLSAKPTLAVHIQTDDHRLSKRMATPDDSVLDALHGLGWQVNNWSSGNRNEGTIKGTGKTQS